MVPRRPSGVPVAPVAQDSYPLSMAWQKVGVVGLAGVLGACGARSNLDLSETEPLGSGGASSSSTSTTASSGGGGAGGEARQCTELAWAGPPVGIGVAAATPAVRPRVIRSSPTTTVVVFEFPAGGGGFRELYSVPVTAAFDAWPPALGAVEVHFPLVAPVAVSSGAVGQVAFSTLDPMGGTTILGRFEPEQNGSSFVDLPFFDTPFALAGTPNERFVLAVGPESFMELYGVSTVVTPPLLQPIGSVGCADRPLAAEVVVDGDDFWIANTADLPHDDCLDPDVPEAPHSFSVWRSEGSTLTPTASGTLPEPLVDIDLAVANSVQWVGVQDVLGRYSTYGYGPQGTGVALDLPPSSAATYDLGVMGSDALIARIVPNAAMPDEALHISLRSFFDEVATLSAPPEAQGAASEPFLLVEGDQALVAWADGFGTVWLGRVDCVAR